MPAERRSPFSRLAEDHGLDDMSADFLGAIAAEKHRSHEKAEKRALAQRFLDTCLIPLLKDKIRKTENNNPESAK